MSLKTVLSTAALFGLGALALVPAAMPQASAAKKATPACGLRNLPLVAGYAWTYRSGTDELKISVDEVKAGKDADGKPLTTISVAETYKGETTNLQWTCTADGLRVPPESFMFTGEPAGIWGTQVTITAHQDVWLHKDAEVVADSGWQEKIKADVTRGDSGGRGAKHPDAKLEVERYVSVKAKDPVNLPIGQWNAIKVDFELRARAIVGEDKQELVIIDDKNPGSVWLVPDVGVVKYQDNLKTKKVWELVSTTVPL